MRCESSIGILYLFLKDEFKTDADLEYPFCYSKYSVGLINATHEVRIQASSPILALL
jgi:hypothetical protein